MEKDELTVTAQARLELYSEQKETDTAVSLYYSNVEKVGFKSALVRIPVLTYFPSVYTMPIWPKSTSALTLDLENNVRL